jgi:hypothetical protein
MKKKSKCASLAQQNGFGPAVLHSLLRLVKRRKISSSFFVSMLQQSNFFFQHSFLVRRKSIQKKKNMCGKALGYNGKAKEKKCAKKKACGNALVDMAKAHCYQSREL